MPHSENREHAMNIICICYIHIHTIYCMPHSEHDMYILYICYILLPTRCMCRRRERISDVCIRICLYIMFMFII